MMDKIKKICFVSTTRADYGIMRPLIKKFNRSDNFDVRIVVSGMHLEHKYGDTYKNIENDGFDIDLKIPMHLENADGLTIISGLSVLMKGIGEYLLSEKFDLIIILGDRYELLPVVNAAVVTKTPIAHFHGGELTLGNYDELIRHSITKMSHLHIVSTEKYKYRVMQMGESDENILNAGALGAQNVVQNKNKYEKKMLEKYNLSEKYAVVLFHPETLNDTTSPKIQIEILLKALSQKDMQFIFIGSNSDQGSDEIMNMIYQFVENDKFNSMVFESLTTIEYHTLIYFSQFLIGNSSSGIIEVPSLNVPTINLGNRQEGRIRGNTVIDVANFNEKDIEDAIFMALSDEFVSNINKNGYNPYFKENSVEETFNFIVKKLDEGIEIKKYFVDRNWE